MPETLLTLEHFYGIHEVLRRPDSSSPVIRHEKRVIYPDEIDVKPTLTLLGVDSLEAEEPEVEAPLVRRLVQSLKKPIQMALMNHFSHP